MSSLLIMLTSLAPSPMDSVTAFLYFFTKLTTFAFCLGVTRQQITASHSQAMSTKSVCRDISPCLLLFESSCDALISHRYTCLKSLICLIAPVSSPSHSRPSAVHPEGCWPAVAFLDDEDADDDASSFFHTESHSEKMTAG